MTVVRVCRAAGTFMIPVTGSEGGGEREGGLTRLVNMDWLVIPSRVGESGWCWGGMVLRWGGVGWGGVG